MSAAPQPVRALAVVGTELFAACSDSSLWKLALPGNEHWSASPVWERIGDAQAVVAMASMGTRIFALDASSRIWHMDMHADAPHWAPWDQPPESAYGEGIDGTLWDRKAIGATSDGHLWAVTGSQQLLRAREDDPSGGWTPVDRALPQAVGMTACSDRLVITCQDLSVRVLDTARVAAGLSSPSKELPWQFCGSTPMLADHGLAALETQLYATGTKAIHGGVLNLEGRAGSTSWFDELILPPASGSGAAADAAAGAAADAAAGAVAVSESESESEGETEGGLSRKLIAEISGCVGCRADSDPANIMLCNSCEAQWHTYCLTPKLPGPPKGDWFCPSCSVELKKLKPLERHMHKAWVAVRDVTYRKRHCAGIFLQLPSHTDFPDYYKLIAKPMSLAWVRRRVTEGRYKTWDDFVAAMELVFANAKQYNDPKSPIVADAKRLQKVLDTFKKNVPKGRKSKSTKRPRDSADAGRNDRKKAAKKSEKPRMMKIMIKKEGKLGVKFNDDLVITRSDDDKLGYKAGIRLGMKLVAFQGKSVSGFDDTMEEIRQTERPWEMTFQGVAAAESPASPAEGGSKGPKKLKLKFDKRKHDKQEDPERSAKQPKPEPVPVPIPVPKPRVTEWIEAELPPGVEEGEMFVAKSSRTRGDWKAPFPADGDDGDHWKFEFDIETGECLQQEQMPLSEEDQERKKGEKAEIATLKKRHKQEEGRLQREQNRRKPKGRISAFWCFQQARRGELLSDNPELEGSVTGQSKALSRLWKSLSKEEAKPYYEEAGLDTRRFQGEAEQHKAQCGEEKQSLRLTHQRELADLKDRHRRQRLGEIVDIDPRSDWSLETEFNLTTDEDVEKCLDRSALERCPLGDALACYTHLRSMETVYGVSAFLLEDFLCALVSGSETKLLAEMHMSLLRALNIREINKALQDNSGHSDHLLLNWFSMNTHTWPELLRQTCEFFTHMPLAALGIYLSPKKGHVDENTAGEVPLALDYKQTDDKARLKAARAVQDDAREVVENLHHEYWSLPAAKKIKILLFIVNILSERDDTVDLFKARLRELEMRLPGDEDDDWTGKALECSICGDGGEIMCCDYCACSFHPKCIRPEMKEEPDENEKWYCQFCSVLDAASVSFAPLGVHKDTRYWFVGGHIFGESCASGQFSPHTTQEISDLISALKKGKKGERRLLDELCDKEEHLREAPIPTDLCDALRQDAVITTARPRRIPKNVSSRYLQPTAPAKHSVYWDFTAESGGAWWWHDPATNPPAGLSTWANPAATAIVPSPPPPIHGVPFTPTDYTKEYSDNNAKFSKIHYDFPVDTIDETTEQKTPETLGRSIAYVEANTWTYWENLHLLLLVRRDGPGEWGVKASQMGGRRSAGEVHKRYNMDAGDVGPDAAYQQERLILFKDPPQAPYGEKARQDAERSPASIEHTKDQLLAMESAIPAGFMRGWSAVRGAWVAAVHRATEGAGLAALLAQLEQAMPAGLFVAMWRNMPGIHYNRHFQQKGCRIHFRAQARKNKRTPLEIKELRRAKMERAIEQQRLVEERRRAQLNQRRQAAAAARAQHNSGAGAAGLGQVTAAAGAAMPMQPIASKGGKNSAWTPDEMEYLLNLVRQHGMGKFATVELEFNRKFHSNRSIGSITQKYYKLTRGDSALDIRAEKLGHSVSGGQPVAVREVELTLDEYNPVDDPTVPESELNILQRALRREKDLRATGTNSEQQIQDELATQFGTEVDEFLAAEKERKRKARRKAQPTEWDFDVPFKGWRFDVRDHEPARHLYRGTLSTQQVRRLARRRGAQRLDEFIYDLDDPKRMSDTTVGPSKAPAKVMKSQDPVYMKVEYDNGTSFWGKMRDDNGQEDIGAVVEGNRKRMVQFVDGKMFYLSQNDAAFPVAQTAMKKADKAPTDPAQAFSPRSAARAAVKRVATKPPIYPADTPILSMRGSWRTGIRRSRTVAAVQLHLSCLASAIAWSKVCTVDLCDRAFVGRDPEGNLTIPDRPDAERACWMDLAVRSTMSAVVHAVECWVEGEHLEASVLAEAKQKSTLSVGAINVNQDQPDQHVKGQKHVDMLLQSYDRARTSTELTGPDGLQRVSLRHLDQEKRRQPYKRTYASDSARLQNGQSHAASSTSTATAASAGTATGMHQPGMLNVRKKSDWNEEELRHLVRLVNQQGRLKADWNDIASILGTGRTESAVHQKFNKISRARDGDQSLYEQYTLLDKQEGTQELDGAPEPLPAGWKSTVDKTTNRVYYYHEVTQESRWERPTASDAASSSATATAEAQPTGAQSDPQQTSLDTKFPEHAARASELESATDAPEATGSAVAQTTLDALLPEHAARAQELEQADTQADAMDVVDDS